jgi:F-type H+-transporting ATPase subunit delta
MLYSAARTVADHHGKGLAVVTVAGSLSPQQTSAIAEMLRSRYSRHHYVAEVTNPDIVGGVKIRVGDDVIDGSIATRMQDLRIQLAG